MNASPANTVMNPPCAYTASTRGSKMARMTVASTSAPCWPCSISVDVMALKPDMSTNRLAASNWPDVSPAA